MFSGVWSRIKTVWGFITSPPHRGLLRKNQLQICNMNALQLLNLVKYSPIRNYVVPGVTSWIIAPETPEHGLFRLFTCDRFQLVTVAPHSHRYDLNCTVMNGAVYNTI